MHDRQPSLASRSARFGNSARRCGLAVLVLTLSVPFSLDAATGEMTPVPSARDGAMNADPSFRGAPPARDMSNRQSIGQQSSGQQSEDRQSDDTAPTPTRPDTSPARLGRGEVSLRDFLRLVKEHTGQFIATDSEPDGRNSLGNTIITVLEDVEPFTFPVAEAILALNGFPIAERVLDDGRRIYELSVDAKATRAQRATPVLTGVAALSTLPGLELATLVRPLEHADPQEAVTILRDLLDADASAPGRPKFVAVPTSRQIIVRAPVRLLTHTIVLLDHIDVPRRDAKSTLRIHELQHTAAVDLVEILEQALAEFGDRRGGVAARTSRRGPTASPRGAGSTEETRLIPDPRTQKILVQSGNRRAPALAERHVAELDLPYTGAARHFRVYTVRYHRASKLAETLQAWLQGSELDRRFTVVAHDPSNTILIRGTDSRDGAVLNTLFGLDRPEPVNKVTPENHSDAVLEGYRPEHRTPAELVASLEAQFGELPHFRVLPYAPSGSVVLRVPTAKLAEVRAALRAHDRRE